MASSCIYSFKLLLLSMQMKCLWLWILNERGTRLWFLVFIHSCSNSAGYPEIVLSLFLFALMHNIIKENKRKVFKGKQIRQFICDNWVLWICFCRRNPLMCEYHHAETSLPTSLNPKIQYLNKDGHWILESGWAMEWMECPAPLRARAKIFD